MLQALITSKTRLRLLIKFFVQATNQGYLNGLAQEFGESTNAIRKELNHLSKAGYLLKTKSNNKVIYLANSKHPLFPSLQKIVRQHLGLEIIAEQVIQRMGKVETISLIGDYAKGIDSGLIEIVVCGEKVNNRYLLTLSNKLSRNIGRRVRIETNIEQPKDGVILYVKKTGHDII